MNTSDEEIGLIIAKMPNGEASDMLRSLKRERGMATVALQGWAIIAERLEARAEKADKALKAIRAILDENT